jgi:hypothetical protein
MLIKFEVGGVYRNNRIPVKVTRIAETITRVRSTLFEEVEEVTHMWVRQVGAQGCWEINVDAGDIVRADRYDVQFAGVPDMPTLFTARDFHCLHPFFPSDNSLCKAYLGPLSPKVAGVARGCPKLPEWLHYFHKKIMKTFVLFFFSIKLIVIARRAKRVVKKRMCALILDLALDLDLDLDELIAGVDRAAKSQRIE